MEICKANPMLHTFLSEESSTITFEPSYEPPVSTNMLQPPHKLLASPDCDDFKVLVVDLPGVKKSDIDIEIHGQTLNILANRYEEDAEGTSEIPKDDTANVNGEVSKEEKVLSKYRLTIVLGRELDGYRIISSTYKDGVLALAIPVRKNHRVQKVLIE